MARRLYNKKNSFKENEINGNIPSYLIKIFFWGAVFIASFIFITVIKTIHTNFSILGIKRTSGQVHTVFVITLENHNWSTIYGSTSAPYINKTLLPMASHAEQYYNPPSIHPSLPNYLWLEAGTNFEITDDNNPQNNHQNTREHLVTLLSTAGVSWKSYQEGISGTDCPLKNQGLYVPKHNPLVYFDDVTDTNSTSSATCIAHIRPFNEMASDLTKNTISQYNFITPNLCDDMHDSAECVTKDSIKNGDNWLRINVPKILNSRAYKTGGVVFIVWDEGESSDGSDSDGPIGMIVLSPFVKGHGYANQIRYTHSSTLRTIEEIFGVSPLLADAAHTNDLGDLFLPGIIPTSTSNSLTTSASRSSNTLTLSPTQ